MRASLLLAVITTLAVAGCTDTTLSDDTAFRRVVDGFESYDQCIAQGNPSDPCYQTLTLCSNGNVLMDLDNHQQEGSYELDGDSVAVAKFTTATIVFDLDTASSTQLPGKPWERVQPTFYGCDITE